MRIFIILLLGLCTLVAQADTLGQEETTQQAESPWQGDWAGSENSSLGMKKPVRAKITVTNGTISGTWNAQQGLQPITGQVDGEEASITILQGGSMIKATLTDGKTLKYSGIRGYGTLTKQTKE